MVGVGVTENADAWGRWRRPFVARYYGPPAYYDSYVPYRTYYRGYYGPQFNRQIVILPSKFKGGGCADAA